MKKTSVFIFLILIAISCSTRTTVEKAENTETDQKEEKFEGLLEKANITFGQLPALADNEKNPITPEKIQLGKMLYFDTRLSKDGNISCNSCHNLNTYGVDNLPTSPGDKGQNGERNSPTVFNAAFHTSQFWDGRAKDVEEQAGGPILNPVEMAVPDEKFLIKRLKEVNEYQELFRAAFPGDKDPLKYSNVQKAIAAFERKLITPAPFDDYLDGNENALTSGEKRGLQTFINTGCNSCHMGPLLGGNIFQKFGVFDNYWDLTGSKKMDEGRFAVTGNENEKYYFKVPSLRNVAKTFPYFHDGSVETLEEAVTIMAKAQLNVDLTEEERQDIVAFLGSLTGNVPHEIIQPPVIP